MSGAKRLYALVDRVLRALELIAVLIAAAMMLAAMVLMTIDTLMRYGFNNPLLFQLPLTEDYLLVGLVMLALPWGFRTGGYIRISGVAGKLPPALRLGLFRIGLLVSAAYTAMLCWQSWMLMVKVFIAGETKMGVMDFPIWLSQVWVPIGLGLLTARLVMTAIGPDENVHVEHDSLEEL